MTQAEAMSGIVDAKRKYIGSRRKLGQVCYKVVDVTVAPDINDNLSFEIWLLLVSVIKGQGLDENVLPAYFDGLPRCQFVRL